MLYNTFSFELQHGCFSSRNRYTPQIDPLPHSTGRSVQQPAHAPPAHISTEPIESTNRYTETSLATPALSSSTSRTGPSLSAASRMNQPPSSSESPWSFIQSVGKGGVRQGEMSEGVREGRGRWGLRGSKWRSHRHYSHHHHSPAYWQRARHHRHITNPLAKVKHVCLKQCSTLPLHYLQYDPVVYFCHPYIPLHLIKFR